MTRKCKQALINGKGDFNSCGIEWLIYYTVAVALGMLVSISKVDDKGKTEGSQLHDLHALSMCVYVRAPVSVRHTLALIHTQSTDVPTCCAMCVLWWVCCVCCVMSHCNALHHTHFSVPAFLCDFVSTVRGCIPFTTDCLVYQNTVGRAQTDRKKKGRLTPTTHCLFQSHVCEAELCCTLHMRCAKKYQMPEIYYSHFEKGPKPQISDTTLRSGSISVGKSGQIYRQLP